MAHRTYHQLPKKKQQRILEALLDEFSQVTYSEASINRIVKHANISRGSFYQYFANKEDAYLEVLAFIAERKRTLFETVVQPQSLPQDNVFDQAIVLLQKVAIWMEKEPRLYRIGVLMDLDRSEIVEKLRQRNPGMDRYFEHLIQTQQQAGLIDASIDARLLSEMMSVLSQHFLVKHFNDHHFERMIEEAKMIYHILKKGSEGATYV